MPSKPLLLFLVLASHLGFQNSSLWDYPSIVPCLCIRVISNLDMAPVACSTSLCSSGGTLGPHPLQTEWTLGLAGGICSLAPWELSSWQAPVPFSYLAQNMTKKKLLYQWNQVWPTSDLCIHNADFGCYFFLKGVGVRCCGTSLVFPAHCGS